MSEKKYISVSTSRYALLNPDRTAQSVPLNAHFEIVIRKASGSGEDAEDTGKIREELENGDAEAAAARLSAKPAPVAALSMLAGGEYPLFGNSQEAAAFADSLITDDPRWSKSYTPGSDTLKFTYNGGAGTLAQDFVLRIYSDAFNSTAAYRGQAVMQVESRNFSQQFDDAFDDNYTVSTAQMYVPKITAFAPDKLTPVKEGGTEYLAALGDEILLTWTVCGDFLKSPVLRENGKSPETVSFDTPVKRKICGPAVFELTVESNAAAGLCDRRSVSFGISVPPSVSLFQAGTAFCLPGHPVLLEYSVSGSVSASISPENSAEEEMEVPVSGSSVTVRPAPVSEAQRRVSYTLTARGFRNRDSAAAVKSVSVFVSRWKKAAGSSKSVPLCTENDTVVRMFRYRKNYYCFAGQAVWKSGDGIEWTKLSAMPLPAGTHGCRTAAGICDGVLYAVGAAKDNALYLARYRLETGQWSDSAIFGPAAGCAGGAFVFVSDDRMYYFCAQGVNIGCYNYAPEPFDCWGLVGYLELPSGVLDTDCLLYGDKLYIAAVCEDQKLYVVRASRDLKDTGTRRSIAAPSAWVRLAETNGQAYVLTEAGIYAADTGAQEDMLFTDCPQILGASEDGFAGIGKDGSGWSFCC